MHTAQEKGANVLFLAFSPVLKLCLVWQNVRTIDQQKNLTIREGKGIKLGEEIRIGQTDLQDLSSLDGEQ